MILGRVRIGNSSFCADNLPSLKTIFYHQWSEGNWIILMQIFQTSTSTVPQEIPADCSWKSNQWSWMCNGKGTHEVCQCGSTVWKFYLLQDVPHWESAPKDSTGALAGSENNLRWLDASWGTYLHNIDNICIVFSHSFSKIIKLWIYETLFSDWWSRKRRASEVFGDEDEGETILIYKF